MDEWNQFQREEQTPNRDWSYLLQVIGEAAAPYFTTPPSPSSEYKQRAAHVTSLIQQRRQLREALGAAIHIHEISSITDEHRALSRDLRRQRRRYLTLWRQDIRDELVTAHQQDRKAE
eukprot:3514595-Pyramimonas_sp.AAC.1